MGELTIRKRRILVVLVILGLFALLLVGRTISIQTFEHDRFVAEARNEHLTVETIHAQRGAIRDRNGRPLATTIQIFDIYALPAGLTPVDETVAALAPLLGIPAAEIESRVVEARKSDKDMLLKRGVAFDVGEAIAGLRLSGIYRTRRIARAYPEGNLAAGLLGFVGRDQIGLTGVESDFNRELVGRHGQITYERDGVGAEIPLGYREVEPPVPGKDVILTIDRFIQSIVEDALDRAVAKHDASGGSIIVMDPNTGEILAMASRPSFNLLQLNDIANFDLALFRNRTVTDLYEPGSTFKAITVAAAIDAGAVRPQTTFFDKGVDQSYGIDIWNWNREANGFIDVTEMLRVSSNVVAIRVAEELGPDRFYEYLDLFGFGRPTNVELSGEAQGNYRVNGLPNWAPIDLATNAYGQGITATPLQLIAAYSSIINGGKLMRPYIVKEIRGEDGAQRFNPVLVRETISPETSETMRTMLNAAAEQGETNLAIVPGYSIGGKTGTSSIASPTGYEPTQTIASFVGFAPADQPRAIMLIKIDRPKDQPWGSLVASPIFSSLMQRTMIYMNEPPTGVRTALG